MQSSGIEASGTRGPLARFVATAWPYALLLGVGLFILLPKLGEFGLWDPWEPKYSEAVREMIERDSYVVPYYRDKARLAKPILVYWGMLAGALVFGLREFGVRIAGVAFAIGSLLGVYYAIDLLRGRRAALLSALVLATLPQFFFISRQATPDVYLFTSLGVCLVFFCLGLYGPQSRRDLHFAMSYVGFALAVLAKGPIVAGVLVAGPLGLFACALIDWRRLWDRPLRRRTVAVVLVSFVLALALLACMGTALLFLAGPEESIDSMDIVDTPDTVDTVDGPDAGQPTVARGDIRAGAAAAAAFAARVREWLRVVLFGGHLTAGVLVVLCLLAAVAIVVALSALGRWFLAHPLLWPAVAPWLRPVARQLILFAIVFLVVAGPWHIAIVIEQGSQYLTYFIFKHNIQRTQDVINQSGAADFYVRVLAFGFFPWSCLIPVALAALVGFGERDLWKKRGLEVVLLTATAVTLTGFSLSATKFAHYLAPALIPVAVLVGLTIDRLLEAPNRTTARLAWVAAFLLFLPPALDLMRRDGPSHLIGSFSVKSYVPEDLGFGAYYQVLLVAVGLLLLASAVARSRVLVGVLVACSVLMANYANATFIPALTRHKTMKNLCDTWRAAARNGEPIGFYGDVKHGIFFYTDYTVKHLRSRSAFHEFMNPAQSAFCVVERTKISRLEQEFREKYPDHTLRIIDDSHFKYALLRAIPTARGPDRPQ